MTFFRGAALILLGCMPHSSGPRLSRSSVSIALSTVVAQNGDTSRVLVRAGTEQDDAQCVYYLEQASEQVRIDFLRHCGALRACLYFTSVAAQWQACCVYINYQESALFGCRFSALDPLAPLLLPAVNVPLSFAGSCQGNV